MLNLEVRPAAVAGHFYPASANALHAEIDRFLSQATRPAQAAQRPKALIVPHAGYAYSGATAAAAYARLMPWAREIRRVILIGPAHRVALRGLAAPSSIRFATPLGEVPVAIELAMDLDAMPQVTLNDFAHEREHALEVQLPFLQSVLPHFEVLPLVVGEARAPEVAEVLERVWGGDETLLVVSSDLSHYLPEEVGRAADDITLATIAKLDPHLEGEQACGATAINGLLIAARHHGLVAELVARSNSGPVSAREDSVVGYASLALVPASTAKPDEFGAALVALARDAIRASLGLAPSPRADRLPGFQERRACFVTLHTAQGALRGCVGGLEAHQALGEDVIEHARAAAFRDPRFAPLEAAELEGLEVSVAVLGPLCPIEVQDEEELLAALRPGEDGLVLEAGTRHATFLPQVWQSLRDPRRFVGELKRKAGFSGQDWDSRWRWSRYTVESYGED